ncbi:MAG: SufD family Fe-S cluster assembly protein [Cyanobium sp. MAG06]|nr:SufD family Fe-S cluster assembly protein [Cyanobium sp. MAG06]
MLKNYSLKINTPYTNYIEETIDNASGIINLKFGKIYKIKCINDVYINHNIENGLLHIICESMVDNININIICNSPVKDNILADIYHEIINNHNNTRMNITVRSIVSNGGKIIYRSSLTAVGDSSGEGEQNAKFIVIDDNTNIEINAIPGLNIANKNNLIEHKLSISRVNNKDLFYLSLFGFDNISAQNILTENI